MKKANSSLETAAHGNIMAATLLNRCSCCSVITLANVSCQQYQFQQNNVIAINFMLITFRKVM